MKKMDILDIEKALEKVYIKKDNQLDFLNAQFSNEVVNNLLKDSGTTYYEFIRAFDRYKEGASDIHEEAIEDETFLQIKLAELVDGVKIEEKGRVNITIPRRTVEHENRGKRQIVNGVMIDGY